MKYITQLSGLHCDACKKVTEKRLGKIEGVTLVETDLLKQLATIESNREISSENIQKALEGTEYKFISLTRV